MQSKWYRIKRSIRYRIFKLKHGFSPRELWNLDFTIAKFTYPRLLEFRNTLNSYPGNLTLEEWRDILDKMLFSMEQTINHDSIMLSDDETIEEYNVRSEKIAEGYKLFGEYFGHLWN